MDKKNRLRTVFLIIFIVFVSAMAIMYITYRPSLRSLSKMMDVDIPSNAKILFYKRVGSLTSEAIYLKLKLKKNDWSNFNNSYYFEDAHEGTTGNNVFSGIEIKYENWNPQSVNKSLSGRFTIDEKYKRTIVYLFDIQNKSWVDCYFAIYQ
jgi:hypothetical protein